MPSVNQRILTWLICQAKPHWKTCILSIALMAIVAILEPALPALIRPLIDENLIGKNSESLWLTPVLILCVFLLKSTADYFSAVLSHNLAQSIVAKLRHDVFAVQLDLPVDIHNLKGRGFMLGKIAHDPNMLADSFSSAWLVVIRDSLILVGLIGFLFYTAWHLAILVTLAVPPLILIISRAGKSLRGSNSRYQELVAQLIGYASETFQGLREVKIFLSKDNRLRSFNALNQELKSEHIKMIRIQALSVPIVQIVAAFSVCSVILFASILSANSLLTTGEFVAFITAVALIFEPARRLTNVNATLQRGFAAAAALRELLLEPTEPTGNAAPNLLRVELSGKIEFRNVTFTYAERVDSIFSKFNLDLAPGESVAIVGPSGSGKSTLLHLVSGFVLPDSGSVLFDGREITAIGLTNVRRAIASVSQDTWLFNGTLEDNIRMGRTDATRAQVIEAAKSANAWEFISQLPSGLETSIGELGSRLSGGQRQRIAIARALIKDAKILLLDEATSALDPQSEMEVMDALKNLMRGRTTLFVSHAPDRLPRVDKILDLKITA